MKKSLQLKLIMILAGIIIAANKVTAQTPFHLMNNSGTIYSFTLEEKPRFWHSGQLLHMHTDNLKINFVLNKVAQIFWDNDIPTSISATAENKIYFSIRDGKLYVSGTPNSTIHIYSLKGILCAEVEPTGDETETIDIDNLANGTYIVRTSDFTFKFMKQ